MNDEQLRTAAAQLNDRRVPCIVCGVWTARSHTWDDGLRYSGGRCRDHARPIAEQIDRDRRAEIAAWEAFAQVEVLALPEAERLAREYAAEREGRFDHLHDGTPQLPARLWAAFRRFMAQRPPDGVPSLSAARTRRRAGRRPIPAGGM